MKSVIVENNEVQATLETCDSRLKAAYERVIDALKCCEISSGMRLRPTGSAFYLRVTKEARLVLLRERVGDKDGWVLLEFIPFHNYRKATFFNKQKAINRFREKYIADIEALVASAELGQVARLNSESSAGAGAGAESEVEDEVTSATSEIILHQNHVIEPSRTQSEHINKILKLLISETTFAALMAGPPGSGKTILACELVRLLMADPSFSGRIIYVAQSPYLRREVERQWQSSASYSEENSRSVSFNSYESLLAQCGVSLEGEAVTDDDLKAFFDRELKKSSQLKGEMSLLKPVSFEQFRQECDLIASSKDLAHYQAIGSNHSLFHGNEQLQAQLWELYESYDVGLKEKGMYHPKFVKLDPAIKIASSSVLIVDESLDLSRCQQQNLLNLGAKVLFLGDYNQDLAHVSHTLEYLRHLVGNFGGQKYIGKLRHTFRCASNVAAVANHVLGLKQKLVSHGSDLAESKIESGLNAAGSITLVNPSASKLETIRGLCQRTDTAVICADGQQNAVSKRLNSLLTFSVEGIKGLGYRRVVLWDLVSPKQAGQYLKLFTMGKRKRADITPEQKTMLVELNHLFTAITRAELEVVISGRHISHPMVKTFFQKLISEISPDAESAASSMPVATPSTQQEWKQQALELIDKGQRDLAERIADAHHFVLPSQDAAEEESKPAEYNAVFGVLESKSDPVNIKGVETAVKGDEVVAEKVKPVVVDQSDPELALTFRVAAPATSKRSKSKRSRAKKKASHDMVINFSQSISASDIKALLGLDRAQFKLILLKHVIAFLNAIKNKDCPINDLKLFFKKLVTDNQIKNELRSWLQTNLPPKNSMFRLLVKDIEIQGLLVDLTKEPSKPDEKSQPRALSIDFLKGMHKKSAATFLFATVFAAGQIPDATGYSTYLFHGLLLSNEGTVVLLRIFTQYRLHLQDNRLYHGILLEYVQKYAFQKSTDVELESALLILFDLFKFSLAFDGSLNVLFDHYHPQPFSSNIWVGLLQNCENLFIHIARYAIDNKSIRAQLLRALDFRSNVGHTIWHVAAQYSPKSFQFLLNFAINSPDFKANLLNALTVELEGGCNIWHFATRHSLECFKVLVNLADSDSDIRTSLLSALNVPLENGWNVWHFAARHSLECFKLLVNLADSDTDIWTSLLSALNALTRSNWTVWHLAARNSPEGFKALVGFASSDPEFRETLLKALNDQTEDGWNVWHLAASYSPEGFKALICLASNNSDFRANLLRDINDRPYEGWSIWHRSARHSPEVFKFLVDLASSDPELRETLLKTLNDQTGDGWNVWHLAARNSLEGFKALVDLADSDSRIWTSLLSALNALTEGNSTVWHLATRYSPEVFEVLVNLASSDPELREILLKALNDQTQDGWNVWHLAASYSPEGFKALICLASNNSDYRANLLSVINHQAHGGWTVWHRSARHSPEVFEVLVNLASSDPELRETLLKTLNDQTEDDWNVWHLAARNSPEGFKALVGLASSDPEFRETLLKALNYQTSDGLNVWGLAAEYSPKGFKALVDLALSGSDFREKLLKALNDQTKGGLNVWLLAAKHSPKVFKALVNFASSDPEFRETLLKASNYQTTDGLNVWYLVAKHSPEIFKALVDLVCSDSDFRGKLIDSLKGRGAGYVMSLWSKAASASDDVFAALTNLALDFPDVLAALLDDELESASRWTIWHHAAKNGRSHLTKLIAQAEENDEILASLVHSVNVRVTYQCVWEFAAKKAPDIFVGLVQLASKKTELCKKLIEILNQKLTLDTSLWHLAAKSDPRVMLPLIEFSQSHQEAQCSFDKPFDELPSGSVTVWEQARLSLPSTLPVLLTGADRFEFVRLSLVKNLNYKSESGDTLWSNLLHGDHKASVLVADLALNHDDVCIAILDGLVAGSPERDLRIIKTTHPELFEKLKVLSKGDAKYGALTECFLYKSTLPFYDEGLQYCCAPGDPMFFL